MPFWHHINQQVKQITKGMDERILAIATRQKFCKQLILGSRIAEKHGASPKFGIIRKKIASYRSFLML